MAAPGVLLVELEGLVAVHVTQRLGALGVDVATSEAADAVKKLVAEPPALAIVNLELSQGSGFGLVNRAARMEALAGLKIVIVADASTTDAALDTHRKGPTPATAYVRRAEGASSEALGDAILEVAQRLLTDPEGEEREGGEVVHVAGRARATTGKVDPLAAVIGELGYRVLRRLRDEDGGAVFACMDDELKRPVAIKLMPGDANDERLQRFQRERRILALLSSPHVISVYGAGTHRGTPYLVRELIDGESLAGQIAREGPLDVVTALQRVHETALGLRHAAAAGVIHRDVRPENIHVVDGHAKLARFGMGRREAPDEARITHNGLQLPDVTYVAPERIRGHEDARGDIYALGVTLHTLVAGRPPFAKQQPLDIITGRVLESPTPLDVARPGTPPAVVAIVERCMAEDPAQRPQTWDAVLALIDDALRAVTAEMTTPPSPAPVVLDEPEAVHGSLRIMSVIEIAQSLELARKTAVVELPSAEEGDGTLAFDAGRLVHASRGALAGEDAFFALVGRKRGAFRVQYDSSLAQLPQNITTPVTGLILEAARRADMASSGAPHEASGADANDELATADAALLDDAPGAFAQDDGAGLGAAPRDEARLDDASLDAAFGAASLRDGDLAEPDTPRGLVGAAAVPDERARPERRVPTWLGFVAIAACTALFVYGGMQAPSVPELLGDDVDDDPSMPAVAALLAANHAELRDARARIATLEPRLAAFEEKQASADSAAQAAREKAAELKASLEAALQPELEAGRFALRTSEDGAAAVLEIGERALFLGDGDDVAGDGRTVLARISGALATVGDVRVRVEGHSDDGSGRARHKNAWGHTGARAIDVARVLVEQGVSSSRVKAVAMADTKPLVPNRGAKNRAKNRRIELHVSVDP